MCQYQLITQKLEEIPRLKDKAQRIKEYFLETANLSASLPARESGERLRLLAERFNDFRTELSRQNLLSPEEIKNLQNRDIYFKIIGPGLMNFSRLVSIISQNQELMAQAGNIVGATLKQNPPAEIIAAIGKFRKSLEEIKVLPQSYLLAPEEIYRKIILPARQSLVK